MFKSPFSFEGRIRRLEFGLSYLIFMFLYFPMALVWQMVQNYPILFYLYFVVLIWFFIAQGAKRCHDLGNSGFYQFIPLYGLWMFFQDGEKGINKYGTNPKTGPEISENGGEEQKHIQHPNYIKLLTEISTFVLLNTLLMSVIYEFLTLNEFLVYAVLLLTIIPCFFLVLVLSKRNSSESESKSILFKQRMLYSTLSYLLFRTYLLIFKGADLDIEIVYYELIIIMLFMATTFIPLSLYRLIPLKKFSATYEA